MQLTMTPQGDVHCLYSEDIDLSCLGSLAITRASYVEPDLQGQWFADLSPVGGPKVGPFAKRSDALTGEQDWLVSNLLSRKLS